MKRLMIAACVLALAGCQSNPGAPSSAGTTMLRANIAATSAVPAVTGPEAGGTGTVTITLRTTRENGVITRATADFAIALTGYPAGTQITAANIRVGSATANGAIVQDTGLEAQGGATLETGSGTMTVAGVAVSGPVANALVANAGGYYFNVQSTLNPGTTARGQLLFP